MKYFFIFTFLFFITLDSQANYSRAANTRDGVGYYGGTVPCPYGNKGRSRGRAQGPSLSELEEKVSDLEESQRIAEDELNDLEDVRDDRYEDRLFFKPGVSNLLAAMANRDCASTQVEPSEARRGLKIVEEAQAEAPEPFTTEDESGCYFNESPENVCALPEVYSLEAGSTQRRARGGVSTQQKECRNWLKDYKEALRDLNDINDDLEKAEEDLRNEENKVREQERKERRNARKGIYTVPEGQGCDNCDFAAPEPQSPSFGQVLVAGISDGIGILGYNKAYRYISRNNAALGWDTPPPSPLGAYPFNLSNLMNSYRGGGQGAGSWGCSQTVAGNYPNGANGIWGPSGQYSQYGNNAGAPFYAPAGCNYGCVNNGQNGPFIPGISQWGVNGPNGSNGLLANLNPFLNGLNGGNFNSNGAAYGNFNLYGANGNGNQYYPNQFNGLNSLNPLSAFNNGNMFLNGQYNNGNAFLNFGQYTGPGLSPFANNGLGLEAQIQYLRTQEAASARALQNQQVVGQQISAIQSDYQQLVQRYQRVLLFSQSSGGLTNNGLSINGSININTGYTPYPTYNQYYQPSYVPTTVDDSTGR